MRTSSYLIAILMAGLTIAACGGGSTALGSPPPGTIEVALGTFSFKPATITLTAGAPATLRLRNTSDIEHDFFIGQQPDMTASRFKIDFFQGVQVQVSGKAKSSRTGGGFRILVPLLSTAQIAFVVPDQKGTWEIGCFLPGHYEGGMKGTLIVK